MVNNKEEFFYEMEKSINNGSEKIRKESLERAMEDEYDLAKPEFINSKFDDVREAAINYATEHDFDFNKPEFINSPYIEVCSIVARKGINLDEYSESKMFFDEKVTTFKDAVIEGCVMNDRYDILNKMSYYNDTVTRELLAINGLFLDRFSKDENNLVRQASAIGAARSNRPDILEKLSNDKCSWVIATVVSYSNEPEKYINSEEKHIREAALGRALYLHHDLNKEEFIHSPYDDVRLTLAKNDIALDELSKDLDNNIRAMAEAKIEQRTNLEKITEVMERLGIDKSMEVDEVLKNLMDDMLIGDIDVDEFAKKVASFSGDENEIGDNSYEEDIDEEDLNDIGDDAR